MFIKGDWYKTWGYWMKIRAYQSPLEIWIRYLCINRTNKQKTARDHRIQVNEVEGFFLIKCTKKTRGGKTKTIAVTNLEVLSSVFNILKQNKKFTIYRPGYWQDPDTLKTSEEIIEQRKNHLNLNNV